MWLAEQVTLGRIIQAFQQNPSSIYIFVGAVIVFVGVVGIGGIAVLHWIAHHKITTGVIVFMVAVLAFATCVNGGKVPTQPELRPTISASPR